MHVNPLLPFFPTTYPRDVRTSTVALPEIAGGAAVCARLISAFWSIMYSESGAILEYSNVVSDLESSGSSQTAASDNDKANTPGRFIRHLRAVSWPYRSKLPTPLL